MQPKDYKTHLTHINGDWQDNNIQKSTTKPRNINTEVFLSMVEQRDRLFYGKAEQSNDTERMDFLNNRHGWNIEHGMIGVRSAPKHKIVTEVEDKAKKRKHEEIELQAAFCMWVKKNHPEVKFLRHEREKQRSNFMQNQMQVLNSAGSMPDWETTFVVGNYTGLLIEFKKPGEKWLMADGETIKTEYAFQYKCHVDLWKQRRVVYFCNDLEIAKMILEQYLAGRIMRQRVYKYPLALSHLSDTPPTQIK